MFFDHVLCVVCNNSKNNSCTLPVCLYCVRKKNSCVLADAYVTDDIDKQPHSLGSARILILETLSGLMSGTPVEHMTAGALYESGVQLDRLDSDFFHLLPAVLHEIYQAYITRANNHKSTSTLPLISHLIEDVSSSIREALCFVRV